jgi:hypothetical protein
MTADQADEAAIRYAEGETLMDLALAYHLNTAIVRYHLLKRGVVLRPRGRPKGRQA